MDLKLVVIGGKQTGMEIPVRTPKFLIGRGEECQLRPQSTMISRKHCGITIVDGKVAIEDFGSTNGTFVNGEKLTESRKLNSGDRIKVGMFELEVRLRVDVADVKKPKVHSVQEAVARTAASTPKRDDDMDISSWLADDDDDEPSPTTTAKHAPTEDSVGLAHDTIVGKPSDETTTTMPTTKTPPKKEDPKKEGKPAAKGPGQFKVPPKPMAESSRSAAEDVLRHLLSPHRK
jgi:pSer/pThr/pTyr-binding forkhead associated (FHA) protein